MTVFSSAAFSVRARKMKYLKHLIDINGLIVVHDAPDLTGTARRIRRRTVAEYKSQLCIN